MLTTHNLGFPRIGDERQLKFALEKYWKNEISQNSLQQTGKQLRHSHWQQQSILDFVPVGDFSFYDQVLDTSFLFGNLPGRITDRTDNSLDNYFRVARGRASNTESDCQCIHAAEMTKWFDTNYHYIVPEFDKQTRFSVNSEQLLEQIQQAKKQGHQIKPVIIGPVTYLWLGKSKDGSDRLELLDKLLVEYAQLLNDIAAAGISWVQLDEPILVTELSEPWRHALHKAYYQLQSAPIKILLATYFGQLQENLQLCCELPVNGIHIDAVRAKDEVSKLIDWLPAHKVISLGIIDGRNIWKTDLHKTLLWLKPIYEKLNDRLWLAPSCSLLHVPVDLDKEQNLDNEIKSWLAFARQKINELNILARALSTGHDSVKQELEDNQQAINSRKNSSRVHINSVKQRTQQIDSQMTQRQSNYTQRAKVQKDRFNLPRFPTTTIGSFPQTSDIRRARKNYRLNKINAAQYQQIMHNEIRHCIAEQENLGLDVLVHGEAERNDMVEYFGEQLAGYAFSQFGWVQSYGSRCVKPPIIFGDIYRPATMTTSWIKFAQSLTRKYVKGMLTGPVTILNWSFVRDDQPRSKTAMQIALAIRDEVLELEQEGIHIIQIDEAALREGLPLRKAQWQGYLDWAVKAFQISANGVKDDTQIHTHMCYSEFNDIIKSIAQMDADVITIETSRSDMELLDVFDEFKYPNQIGPGVYDIHSPNIPSVESMVELMQKAAQRIPAERLWINPDCGLKTRNWDEVRAALKNMVTASKVLNAA